MRLAFDPDNMVGAANSRWSAEVSNPAKPPLIVRLLRILIAVNSRYVPDATQTSPPLEQSQWDIALPKLA